jgi:hypothetical protein
MKAAFTNLFAALPNVLFSSKFFEIVNIRTFDIRTPDIRGGWLKITDVYGSDSVVRRQISVELERFLRGRRRCVLLGLTVGGKSVLGSI